MADWTPTASAENLRLRGQLLARIREFFQSRDVLEVETPLLGHSTVSDVYIQSLEVSALMAGKIGTRYLQTSPEFAMKRLLASGSGPIFQICKAFRQDECSKRHNSEFTMLEWYRPGFSMAELMDEVAELLKLVLDCPFVPAFSYREIFQRHLEIDPHRISAEALRSLAESRIEISGAGLGSTDYLQLLMAQCIEPELPEYCFIYDYPQAQAALAVVEQDQSGERVAKRFELYGRGMELANGYFELIDPQEQRRRFRADQEKRQSLGLKTHPLDEKFLAALEYGLPSCAGVALGVDRLAMLLTGSDDIGQVISFTDDRA